MESLKHQPSLRNVRWVVTLGTMLLFVLCLLLGGRALPRAGRATVRCYDSLAQWVAACFRDWGALFLALVALVVGGAGLAVTLQLLGPETSRLLPNLWPVILILVGLMMLLRALFGKRPPADVDRD